MGIVIPPRGPEREVRPLGQHFSLEELYRHVETDLVECVFLRDGRTMWLDELGKLREPGVPWNPRATALLEAAGGNPGDFVVGTVLVTDPGEVE